MEYEEEVAEKVWRGKRPRVASVDCGGGVYARRSRSGRRGHNWKESQKKVEPGDLFPKNANIDGGVISFYRWKT